MGVTGKKSSAFAAALLFTLSVYAAEEGNTPLAAREPAAEPPRYLSGELAVFQCNGLDAGRNAQLGLQLLDSITALGSFIPVLMPAAPDSPDVSPEKKDTRGIRFACTSQVYPNEAAGEYHAQVWVWDIDQQKLVITDEMVFRTLDDSAGTMDFLIQFLLSKVMVTPPGKPAAAVSDALSDVESAAVSAAAPGKSGRPAVPSRAAGPGKPAPPAETTNRETTNRETARRWYAAAHYSPLGIPGGETKDVFDQSFAPVGVSSRAAVMPFTVKTYGNLGFEAAVSWNHLEQNGNYYRVVGDFVSCAANGVYKTGAVGNRFVFYGKTGLGFSVIKEQVQLAYRSGLPARTKAGSVPFLLLAAGMEFHPFEEGFFSQWYLELGLNYVQSVRFESLQPCLGMGVTW